MVSAFQHLRRVEKILGNAHIPLNRLAPSIQAAAADLRHLLEWLRQPANISISTGYVRGKIEELATHLDTAAAQADPRNYLLNNEREAFTFIYKKLEIWSRSGKLGNQTLPSIHSIVLQPLHNVERTRDALHKAFLEHDDAAVVTPVQNFVRELDVLQQELDWNLIEMPAPLRAKLQEQRVAFGRTIAPANWHQTPATRELASKAFVNLEKTLKTILEACSNEHHKYRPVEWHPFVLATANDWQPSQAPFAPEFEELLQRLVHLDEALSQNNAHRILTESYEVWGLGRAILEQNHGQARSLAMRYHLTPEMIRSLRDMTTLLGRVIERRNIGSCDPTSPNFLFSQAAADGSRISFPAYDAIEEAAHFLHFWREHSQPIPVGLFGEDIVLPWIRTSLFGQAPREVVVPLVPQALLQRSNALIMDSMSAQELRASATIIVPKLDQAIRRAPEPEKAQLRRIREPLRNLLQSAPGRGPANEQVKQAITQYRLLKRRERIERQIKAAEHDDQARPLAQRGLAGRALKAIADRAADQADRATDALGWGASATVRNIIKDGAKKLHTAASRTLHGTRRVTIEEVDPLQPENRAHAAHPPSGGAHRTGGGASSRPHVNAPSTSQAHHHSSSRSQPQQTSTMQKIGSVLKSAYDLFNRVRGEGVASVAGGAAVSAAGSLGGLAQQGLSLGATKAADLLKSHIEKLHPENDKDKIRMLKDVEKALRKAGNGEGIEQAKKVVKKTLQYMGLMPGGPDDLSNPFFLDLHRTCEDALNFNKRSSPIQRPIKELSDEERKLFVKNNSHFVPMKVIDLAFQCKPERDMQFYAKLIQKARAAGPQQEDQALLDAYMEKLEKAGVSAFSRWILKKTAFPALSSITHRYLGKFAGRGLDWVRDFIAKNNKDTSTSFANRAVDRSNGFMAKLQSAYRRVAEKGTIKGTLAEELESELSKAELNGGRTQEELYQEAGEKLITEYIEPDTMQWGTAAFNYLTNTRFKDSTTRAGAAMHIVATGVAYLGYVVLGAIGWACRKVLLYPVKKWSGYLVSVLVGESVKSVEQNGYTHAINCAIYEQLREVLIALRRHFGIASKEEMKGTKEEDKKLPTVSIVERDKLRALIQEMFSVLAKHKCRTPDSLHKLIHNESLIKKADQELDNLLFSNLTDSVEELLGTALQTLLKKDQLERQFYQLMTTINGIYKQADQIPASEFKAKEEGISKLLDAILKLVIHKTIDQKLDFDKSNENKAAKAFLKEMERTSGVLQRKLRTDYEHLVTKKRANGELPVSASIQSQLQQMMAKAKEAVNKLLDLRTRIEAAGELSSGRTQLLAMLNDLNKVLKGIISPLSDLYNPHARRNLGRLMKEPSERFAKDLREIRELLRDARTNDISRAKAVLQRLRSNLDRFKNEPALSDTSFVIEKEFERIEKAYKEIAEATAIREQLEHGALQLNGSPFAEWYRMLCTPASSSSYATTCLTKITKAIAALMNAKQREKLSACIQELRDATTSQQKTDAYKKFLKAHGEFLRQAHQSEDKALKVLASAENRCKQPLKDARLEVALPPAAIFDKLKTGLQKFEQWTAKKREIKVTPSWYTYIPGVTHAPGALKTFLHNRFSQKAEGLLGFIRDPTIWRHLLFHDNILTPFVGPKSPSIWERITSVFSRSAEAA